MVLKHKHFLIFILAFSSLSYNDERKSVTQNQIDSAITIIEAVCRQQIQNRTIFWGNGWSQSVLFSGICAVYELTEKTYYLNVLQEWAQRHKWRIGKAPFNFKRADNMCAGQTYLSIYPLCNETNGLKDILKTADQVIAECPLGYKEWWWCDALFMAPPCFAYLSSITSERKYIDFMDRMWWESTEYLYDTKEHLFYRDKRFRKRRDMKSCCKEKKIFWARGQGWVIAGLARVLSFMQPDYPNRNRYLALYYEMVDAVVSAQGSDGLWRSNMLCPHIHPQPESSSSALFCYAVSKGINSGFLPIDSYGSVVEYGWKGLIKMVNDKNEVTHVQKKGYQPGPVSENYSSFYGCGVFLLAATEVVILLKRIARINSQTNSKNNGKNGDFAE